MSHIIDALPADSLSPFVNHILRPQKTLGNSTRLYYAREHATDAFDILWSGIKRHFRCEKRAAFACGENSTAAAFRNCGNFLSRFRSSNPGKID